MPLASSSNKIPIKDECCCLNSLDNSKAGSVHLLPAFLIPARRSFPDFPCGHPYLPGHAKPYFPSHGREPGNLLFARPATMSWPGGVPPFDGLGLPAPGFAYERVGLGKLVACEGPFGYPEPLRHFGQRHVACAHLRFPVMAALSPNSPADSPSSPPVHGIELNEQMSAAMPHVMLAMPISRNLSMMFLHEVRWMEGFRILAVSGTLFSGYLSWWVMSWMKAANETIVVTTVQIACIQSVIFMSTSFLMTFI